MAGLPEQLLAPPLNVLRASLHPDGLARRIVNLRQWKDHVLGRLARQAMVTGDPALRTLTPTRLRPTTDPIRSRSPRTRWPCPCACAATTMAS